MGQRHRELHRRGFRYAGCDVPMVQGWGGNFRCHEFFVYRQWGDFDPRRNLHRRCNEQRRLRHEHRSSTYGSLLIPVSLEKASGRAPPPLAFNKLTKGSNPGDKTVHERWSGLTYARFEAFAELNPLRASSSTVTA